MTDPIRQLVLDELPHLDALDEDDDLLAPGMLDSLAIIRVVAALEDAASITILQSEIEPTHFRSLRTLRAFVETKSGSGA
ncbi:MAG: phosphopantetheine-binding protein [Sandaracinaceae bacterium]